MITTSDFCNPGVYYGEASKVDNLYTKVNFVVEVRRNKGLNFYFENNDDIIEVKAFADKDLKWKIKRVDDDDTNSKIVSYTTADLTMGSIYLKLRYVVAEGYFKLFWNSTTTLTSINGNTSKVYSYYLSDATELYASTTNPSNGSRISVVGIIFFIIALIIAIAAVIFTTVHLNRYLFFS